MKKISQALAKSAISSRQNDSHKGDYGRVLLIGGEAEMGGAIIMAASATTYSGAGLVTVATHSSNKTALFSHLPEAMFQDFDDEDKLKTSLASFDVIVIGPGTNNNDHTLDLLQTVINYATDEQYIVIDGGAISCFAENNLSVPNARTIFTPHAMEWQRLSGIDIKDQKEDINQEVCDRLNAAIVLKGHRTTVYFPHANEPFQNTAGTPAQATGGMGDTLAGIIAGFIAQFSTKQPALLSAIFVHSFIAENLAKENYVSLPTMIIKELPRTMKKLASDNHTTFVDFNL